MADLPTDYANETPSADTHPAAHNATNAAVNANTAAIATHTSGIAGNADAIAALTARVTAIESRLALAARSAPVGAFMPLATMSATTGTPSLNALRAYRHTIDAKVDALMVEVTTIIASGTVTAAVYADTNNLPGALVASSAATETSSATGNRILTLNVTIQPGRYWFAIVTQGAACGLRTMSGVTDEVLTPTTTAPPAATGDPHCTFRSGITAALPDPFGTPTGMTNNMANAWLRVAP